MITPAFFVGTRFTPGRLARGLALTAIVALIGGCSGESPSAPSSNPAVITLTNISTTQMSVASGVDYETTVLVSETGGRLGVRLTSIKLTFSNGGVVTFTQGATETVGAGQAFRYVLTSHGVAAGATSVSILVDYVDDRGAAGTTSGSSSVTVSGGSPGGSGNSSAQYSFVSGAVTCTSSGQYWNCSGTMVVRVNKPYAVGTPITLLSSPTAFQFRGTMTAAPPADVTFSMTDTQGNNGRCPASLTSAIELGNLTFPISVAVTCR